MINEDEIEDVDLTKRVEEDWELRYHIRIIDGDIDDSLMDEFEWAFHLQNLIVQPLPDKDNSYDIPEQMQMRAMKIVRDIFNHAKKNEKKILREGKYYTTEYVLNYRLKHQ